MERRTISGLGDASLMSELSLLDQFFVKIEQRGMSPMYMGGALILDPSTAPKSLDGKMIANHLASVMEEVPLMRKKLVQDKLRIGNMRLVEDDKFNVNNHVSVVYLEEADYDELTEYLGQFSVKRMDLDRPLWHFQVIEGLEHGYIAVAMHLHHSILDGVGAMRALGSMWTDKPVPARSPRAEAWECKPGPSTLNLVGSAVAENVKRIYVDTPAFMLRNGGPLLRGLTNEVGRRLRIPRSGEKPTRRALPQPQKTSLNVPRLSEKRVVAYLELPLKDIKALSKKYNCTINDLALFINSWALEYYFREIGENIDFDLICGMPLNARSDGDTTSGNSLGVARVNLHNTIDNAQERLAAICNETQEIKRSTTQRPLSDAREQKVDLGALSGLVSPAILEALIYGAIRFNLLDKATLVNVSITNVPGMSRAMYVAGAKLISNVPMAPCVDSMALTISITSTESLLLIGYHGCGETIVDKELLVQGARDSLSALKPKRKAKKRWKIRPPDIIANGNQCSTRTGNRLAGRH